jgi:5-methyltetrahydrofolate--homocysteine methyltransferase
MAKDEKESFIKAIREKYETIRKNYNAEQKTKTYLSIEASRDNKEKLFINKKTSMVKPTFIGNKFLSNTHIDAVTPFIDWTFFFLEWQIKGKYPEIFSDKIKGKEAKKLYDDAVSLLDTISKKKLLKLNAVIGFYPAVSIDDDIEIYKTENRQSPIYKFNFLRNQTEKQANQPNRCLSDYIAPKDSAINDYIGFFALTAGLGIEKAIKKLNLDEYQALLLHTISHRLAEAYAEFLHREVRLKYWKYVKNEKLELQKILNGKYRGIRPAPGYPTCPDHREKSKIFDLLDVNKQISISLTENFAMLPSASICGYYFANPDAKYFNVGKIAEDQVKDYAKRRNEPIKTTEKWLKHILKYS